ncbi:MAG: 2-aminoethylphosphonate--pyruvate transaminase [Candidatus Latescibacteria bacterium]|jgi:2-aminoethylphosphonate-pyruvate transaminase|nr:2-aminoethylphosphonate--pyruvate transaminase [Candidatus Latescibacterota bacterium]
MEDENPYLLLTPGPLSTTPTVKSVMMRDWCTWDEDYNGLVQDVRRRLTSLATSEAGYTSVLMQGSGTFCVESVIGTTLPRDGKLLVLANGAYGLRIAEIARRLGIAYELVDSGELNQPDIAALDETLSKDSHITHVAAVHCETTTGMLNPVAEIGRMVKGHSRCFILDAMSSFGGIPMDVADLGADFLISSANKCIQGVPGFGFVVALRSVLEDCSGQARSLSLDLYDQWHEMEHKGGKWRFTSPTHTVRAFERALHELDLEGGVPARYARYAENHQLLVDGMAGLGFKCLLPEAFQSPIITSFVNPDSPDYEFRSFYDALKTRGFVIYPGKVTVADTFRIGNIGHVQPENIRELIRAVETSMTWRPR